MTMTGIITTMTGIKVIKEVTSLTDTRTVRVARAITVTMAARAEKVAEAIEHSKYFFVNDGWTQ